MDVATGWVEFVPVWGKGQTRVGGAVHQVRRQLPVPLRGLDADNGSEFLNQHLYGYCQREGITFTRCRAYHKNDQAHVEQKNGAVVRRLIGYDRYSSRAAYAQLGVVYQLVRRYGNFFQPVVKLVGKERVGSRVRKRYDVAQTPYQRLRASGVLGEEECQRLAREYEQLNPVWLRQQLEEALERLWALAERPGAASCRLAG